jgi:hypothetical protein
MYTFTVERSSPKLWATFLIFKNTPKAKNRPMDKKIAQSGHPGWQMQRKVFSKASF